jgi:DNA-binding MarR family transcriptional regulator
MKANAKTKRTARTGSSASNGLKMDVLPELLGYRLRRAQLGVFRDFVDAMASDGLTPGQFGLLTLIGANPGLNQSRLAEAIGVDRSTMVTALNRLEGRGWIERGPSPSDRRAFAVSLTELGQTVLARSKRRVRAHEKRIAGNLSPSQRETLMTLLDALTPGNAAARD